MLKPFSGEKILSPVEMGAKNGGLGGIDRQIDRLIYIAPINSKESLSASVAK